MAVVPEWISQELFENALRNYVGNKSIEIVRYSAEVAIPIGENYASDLFRVSIVYVIGENGKEETMSVVAKCSPQNEMMRNLIEKFKIFETEVAVYVTLLSKINTILGDSEKISANCIYYTNNPKSVIIFEDLSAINFKMYQRQQGLDLEHCLLVVENLALLHAASLMLNEKETAFMKQYNEGIFGNNSFAKKWMTVGFNSLIEACGKWPGFEKYNAKLKAIKDQAFDRIVNARRIGDFSVLNHGDSWINNFMFSYTPEGKLKDFRFVDFPLIVYGSPMIDLNYFWATSPNIDVRKRHLDTIMDHYYMKLVATLTKLQYCLTTVPSKEQLRNDFNSRAFYGLASAVTVLPIVVASKRNDATIENMLDNGDNDGFRHDSYNNERYKKHMEYLLPFFDDLGVLD